MLLEHYHNIAFLLTTVSN